MATEEPPPVRELNPAVPAPLAELIHQLLSKLADARPQSGDEVVRRVQAIASEFTAPRTLPTDSRSDSRAASIPISVTATTNSALFAEVDTLNKETALHKRIDASKPAPAKRQQPSGPWLWPAVGFAAVLVIASVGLVITKNQDNRKHGTDRATISMNDKDGQPADKIEPEVTTLLVTETKTVPVTDTAADRQVAEWVVAQGGSFRLPDETIERKSMAELPADDFKLYSVNFDGLKVADEALFVSKKSKACSSSGWSGTQVTDAGTSHLQELTELTHLNLHATSVSDTGLENLKPLKALSYLGLARTRVSDAGLVHLKEFKGLAHLRLDNTKLSDAGLVHLQELKILKTLYVGGAAVTAEGLAGVSRGCAAVQDRV